MRGCLLAVLFAGIQVSAQEMDSANFGHRTLGSMLDITESAQERRALDLLLRAKEPGQRRSLALDFTARFPSSWLLASAWQAAAAASVDLSDNAGTVEFGTKSIELLPENPLLLTAIARAELLLGKRDKAKLHARDALVWLSVMARPEAAPPAEWETTKRSIEDYLRPIAGRDPAKSPPPAPRGKQSFAGSAVCAPCHRAAFEAWRQSGMAKMLRPRGEAKVLADFSREFEFRDGAGKVEARVSGGSNPVFEFKLPRGGWKPFSVDYAIGTKWQQAYATALPDGRIFVFPLQYNALSKEWINYWKAIDPPGSERARVSRFTDLSAATSYQRNCAVCHTSQLSLTQTGDSSMEHAAFREPGVNCEMCHGPSANHVEAMKAGRISTGTPGEPPFRFGSLDHVEATLICGQCHRQSALRRVNAGSEMNYSSDGPFFARLAGQASAASSPRAVYKDGRFRETTFIGEAFMRSLCFLRGNAQCASCHDPHPADAPMNPASLKFRSDPDRMCLQCHAKFQGQAHTRHAAASPGSRCAACHMPPIMNALGFRAASHQISDIPRAALVARFGVEQSPNACLTCHTDRDLQWLTEQLAEYRAFPDYPQSLK